MGGPPMGGGDPMMERLSSLESKLDQLMGVLNGFLMGQQAGGGSKSGGGGSGGQGDVAAKLDQMMSHMGISPTPAAPDAGGMTEGMAGGPLGIGMPGAPSPPGGPLAPVSPAGMTVSAGDQGGNSGKRAPADKIGALLSDLRR